MENIEKIATMFQCTNRMRRSKRRIDISAVRVVAFRDCQQQEKFSNASCGNATFTYSAVHHGKDSP